MQFLFGFVMVFEYRIAIYYSKKELHGGSAYIYIYRGVHIYIYAYIPRA